jgi:tetratricopeptide (TPR) repeat protein
MRILISLIFAALFVVGVLYRWQPMYLNGHIFSELAHFEAVSHNLVRMRDDLAELLADKPTFARILARIYVARALGACDHAFMAFPEEIADFDRAIRLDPSYARAYVYRGVAVSSYYGRASHYVDGYKKSAIADCYKAIELAPKDSFTQAAYSILSAEYECVQHNPQKAIDVCSVEIANSTSGLNRLYRHRASLYRTMGNEKQAILDEVMAKSFDSSERWSEKCCELSYKWRLFEQLLLLLLPIWLVWTCHRSGIAAKPAP